MDNQTRRILLERVKASGFPGSILDVFQNPTILDQYIAQQQQLQLQSQQQSQPVVAQTPQEQEQGLRPAHAAGNVGQSMIFPNVEPNQSFNTVGMKIPIDINKVDNQGNLVESYKAVPPGITDLPTGPNRGMVIESPATQSAKTGGVKKYQTAGFDTDRIMADMLYPGYTAPTVDIVGYKSDKQREQEYKDWEKSVRNKPLPSGAITPTLSPIDAAVGIAAGIPGLAVKGLQTGVPAFVNFLNTPAMIGSTTLPGVTAGNILGAAGAGYSTQQILDPSSELRTNPNAENILMTGLGYTGLGIGRGLASGAKQTGKYFTRGVKPIEIPIPIQTPSVSNFDLEELRRVYHNSERYLRPEEVRYLHKHGHGLRENYLPNQLPPPPSEIQFMPDGTTRTVYNQQRIVPTPQGGLFGMTPEQTEAAWRNLQNNPNWTNWNSSNIFDSYTPKSVNRSGLSKEEAIAKASTKDKDVISKMSEEEFSNTVLKPTGEVVPYESQVDLMPHFTGNNNVVAMSPKEYSDIFNEHIDLLNDIVAKNNKSGIQYKVKGIDEHGNLTFYTPANQKGKNPLIKQGLEDVEIPAGESTWSTTINPGQWRGNVEDIANTQYFRSIPGLEMRNTTGTVFADRLPRKGTGAYESINEYLKKLDLGRVKSGFNSQTESSKGAWENFIKSGRAVGFYNNPSTVYGTMKSIFPYIGAGYLGYEGLQGAGAATQQKKYGGVKTYLKGGLKNRVLYNKARYKR